LAIAEAFGFSGSIGVTPYQLSIAEPFSLGGGQILSSIGSLVLEISIGRLPMDTEPWMFDTPTSVGFDIFDTVNSMFMI